MVSMTANVHDLLSRRARRHRPALHFDTPIEALTFLRTQVSELQDQTAGQLLLKAEELDLPLSQLGAVIDACLRLYTQPREESR